MELSDNFKDYLTVLSVVLALVSLFQTLFLGYRNKKLRAENDSLSAKLAAQLELSKNESNRICHVSEANGYQQGYKARSVEIIKSASILGDQVAGQLISDRPESDFQSEYERGVLVGATVYNRFTADDE